VTTAGDLDAVDPQTGRTTRIASGIRPNGDVAVRPELDAAYVTATGPQGRPAVWSIPLAACHRTASMVEPDAELPSVSPDGGHLGFVTLNHRGLQTGVDIVDLSAGGRPVGAVRSFPSASVPPPLRITSVAVGRDDASLAVGGGVIDPYLGKPHPTVGTLTPSDATSLRDLVPVFDEAGISIPSVPAGKQIRPEDWQSTPVFMPNGDFLVGDHSEGIAMPFSSGPDGGGIRSIATGTGQLRSLAAGPNGGLAWVKSDGRLILSDNAVDLPFGPAADTPPRTTAAPQRVVSGTFTSVAWTEGPAAESTPLPSEFLGVAHLPSVLGLSISDATNVMAGLDLPVLVDHTEADPSTPAGTVVAQDPAAGDGVLCQCVVVLTVSGT
jgi:hypothetical protein